MHSGLLLHRRVHVSINYLIILFNRVKETKPKRLNIICWRQLTIAGAGPGSGESEGEVGARRSKRGRFEYVDCWSWKSENLKVFRFLSLEERRQCENLRSLPIRKKDLSLSNFEIHIQFFLKKMIKLKKLRVRDNYNPWKHSKPIF